MIALRDMIALICRRTNLSREQAYTLCSLAADLRVTQVVNGNKGIHVMLAKKLMAADSSPFSFTMPCYSRARSFSRASPCWLRAWP